jgi:hypothetical protein
MLLAFVWNIINAAKQMLEVKTSDIFELYGGCCLVRDGCGRNIEGVEYGIILLIDIFARAQSPGARQPVFGSFRGIRTV